MGLPRVYPTGSTIYYPEKCWNGYTVFQAKDVGAILIDMNGNVVQLWKGLYGSPNRILPGGYAIGGTGQRSPQSGFQDKLEEVSLDLELPLYIFWVPAILGLALSSVSALWMALRTFIGLKTEE